MTLRSVTSANVYAVLRLRTTKDQEKFVATNAASLAEAAYNRRAWPRAIYADETPVGFVMLYDDPDKAEYFLWRLMVDQRYQRLGFGRRALELVIDYVRSRPNAATMGLPATILGKAHHSLSMRSLALWKRAKWMRVKTSCAWISRDARSRRRCPATHPRGALQAPGSRSRQVIAECTRRLYGLEGKVPELRAIEVGADILHSGRSYDLALITRFDSLADMRAVSGAPGACGGVGVFANGLVDLWQWITSSSTS